MSYPPQPGSNPDPSYSPQPGVANEPPPRVVHDPPPRVVEDSPRVVRQPVEPIYEERTRPAKTSAAAAFALVFGVAALVTVLTVVFGPIGIILGLIGIVLGIIGIRNARRIGVTGRGVATGGLVLSLVAVLIAVAMAAGVTIFLNDQGAVDRLEQQVQNLRDQLPTDVEIPQP